MRGIQRMRFIVLPLIVGCAVAATSRTSDAPANPIVILVHGRGHLDDDSAAMRRMWKRDLDSALSSVGMPRLRDSDGRLAWYADVLDPESNGACASERQKAPRDDELDFRLVARGIFGTIASALARDESRGLRGLIGDMLYIADWSTRCAAEERVGSALAKAATENRPVILVAYSLGSLVTYAYLNSQAADTLRNTDVRLITIGSPLGVRELRELMQGASSDSLPVPRAVTSWENIYDPYDVFSSPLERIVSAKRVRDRTTQTDAADDVHYIGRYLRDRSTGIALSRALCATAKENLGSACSKIPAN
jgi:hypothetical protein